MNSFIYYFEIRPSGGLLLRYWSGLLLRYLTIKLAQLRKKLRHKRKKIVRERFLLLIQMSIRASAMSIRASAMSIKASAKKWYPQNHRIAEPGLAVNTGIIQYLLRSCLCLA